MIFYSTMPSPIGLIGIAKSNNGLRRVMFSKHAPFNHYLQTLYPQENIKRDDDELTDPINQLNEYFHLLRTKFELKLDLVAPPYYKKVLKMVANIPYGKTASYKTIAEQTGNSKAVRAVGGANANNPITLIIPCHLVLTHSGKLGGFGGGQEKKVFLLELEGSL